MPMTNDRQYRSVNFEIRRAQEEEDSFIVEGYATTWDRYELYDGVFEQFTREAFKETDMSDVIFQYNHSGRVYARQSNGSMELSLDDHGLHVRADLSGSKEAREMYEEIQNGLVTQMSWGFTVDEGDYKYNRKTNTIEYSKIKKIFDVSAVSFPANPYTEIDMARSFCDGEIAKVMEEIQAQEQKRKELELKLKLASI